jgi:outer membrane immunogenic protein
MANRRKTQHLSICAGLALAALAGTAAFADEAGYEAARWTGPYIGMGVGARDTGIDWTTTDINATGLVFQRSFPDSPTTRKFDSVGVQFNGFAGYNFQMQGVVVGIEGTLTGAGDASSKTSQVFPGADNLYTKPGNPLVPNTFDTIKAGSDIGGSIRGRLGVLINPSMMLYGIGGVTIQRFGFTASCVGTDLLKLNSSLCAEILVAKHNVTKVGWTAGAGFEAQLTKSWFWRAEYSYAGLGDDVHTYKFVHATGSVANMTAKVNLDTQVGMVGVAYKF